MKRDFYTRLAETQDLMKNYLGKQNVAKPNQKRDLGEKQLCPECEKKFYDLGNRPAVCPYCATSFDPAEIVVVAPPAPKPVKAATKTSEANPEDGVEEEDLDEEDIDQDEVAAKELELDGDASFGGNSSDDEDEGHSSPNMDGFSTDDDDEDATLADEEDEQDTLPPTDSNNDDEDAGDEDAD
ncbi:MAG: TIGR02300 family protein [Robiginitomaculum sp.]|nr:MAG: TIGR02300 family protein [Robiginitomaculum sp.]